MKKVILFSLICIFAFISTAMAQMSGSERFEGINSGRSEEIRANNPQPNIPLEQRRNMANNDSSAGAGSVNWNSLKKQLGNGHVSRIPK